MSGETPRQLSSESLRSTMRASWVGAAFAVYIGEYKRKTQAKLDRVVLQLFLLPSGPFLMHPEAFDPYNKEENTSQEV